MARHRHDQLETRILTVLAVVFLLFDAVIWRSALASEIPLPATLVRAVTTGPARPVTTAAPIKSASQVGMPVRIKIPVINVNATVLSVALAPDGSMGVPKKPRDTAWYELGPRPGELGSAVIAGHVNWLYGATGAFERLKSLKPGAKISVQDDAGKIVNFVVRASRNYAAAADATDIFTSNDGKAHLNLITCGGTWDKRAGQYTKRLVVFADKVTEQQQ